MGHSRDNNAQKESVALSSVGASLIMTLMKFDSADQFQLVFNPAAPADIMVVIGADWAKTNPMP